MTEISSKTTPKWQNKYDKTEAHFLLQIYTKAPSTYIVIYCFFAFWVSAISLVENAKRVFFSVERILSFVRCLRRHMRKQSKWIGRGNKSNGLSQPLPHKRQQMWIHFCEIIKILETILIQFFRLEIVRNLIKFGIVD